MFEQQGSQCGWSDCSKGINDERGGGVLPGAIIGAVLYNGAPALKRMGLVLYIHICIYICLLLYLNNM